MHNRLSASVDFGSLRPIPGAIMAALEVLRPDVEIVLEVGSDMWMDKLMAGIVRVVTPIGPRHIELSFLERLYFLWIFRHFDTLPQKVLTHRQQRVIDNLLLQKRFVSLPSTINEVPVIGTLERMPIAHVEDTIEIRSAETTPVSFPADVRPRP